MPAARELEGLDSFTGYMILVVMGRCGLGIRIYRIVPGRWWFELGPRHEPILRARLHPRGRARLAELPGRDGRVGHSALRHSMVDVDALDYHAAGGAGRGPRR